MFFKSLYLLLLFQFEIYLTELGVYPLLNQVIGLAQSRISQLLIIDDISTQNNKWHWPDQHLIYNSTERNILAAGDNLLSFHNFVSSRKDSEVGKIEDLTDKISMTIVYPQHLLKYHQWNIKHSFLWLNEYMKANPTTSITITCKDFKNNKVKYQRTYLA